MDSPDACAYETGLFTVARFDRSLVLLDPALAVNHELLREGARAFEILTDGGRALAADAEERAAIRAVMPYVREYVLEGRGFPSGAGSAVDVGGRLVIRSRRAPSSWAKAIASPADGADTTIAPISGVLASTGQEAILLIGPAATLRPMAISLAASYESVSFGVHALAQRGRSVTCRAAAIGAPQVLAEVWAVSDDRARLLTVARLSESTALVILLAASPSRPKVGQLETLALAAVSTRVYRATLPEGSAGSIATFVRREEGARG